MAIFETTYNLRLVSSKKLRFLMFRDTPKLCQKFNCECEISVEKKWWWFNDHYTIKVTGTNKDIKKIETQFKLITSIV